MLRFTIYALPLLVLLLALFGFAVDVFDLEPQRGSVVKLVLFGSKVLAPHIVLATWLLEAAGLLAIYFLAQGRFGWLDGIVAGWIGWIFRGPLLVVTVVTGTGQIQQRWWKIALAWWVLYTICGLALTILDRRMSRASSTSRAAPVGSDWEPEDTVASPSTGSEEIAAEDVVPGTVAVGDGRGEPEPEPESVEDDPVNDRVDDPEPPSAVSAEEPREDFEPASTVERPSEPSAKLPESPSEDETRS